MHIANSTYLEQEYPGNMNTSTIIYEKNIHKYPNNYIQSKVISGYHIYKLYPGNIYTIYIRVT